MNDPAPGFGCLPHLDRSGGYRGWASVAGLPMQDNPDFLEKVALRLDAESPIEGRGPAVWKLQCSTLHAGPAIK